MGKFTSEKSKLMYLNDGDRVLTEKGTGFVEFTGYGSRVLLDSISDEPVYLSLDEVVSKLS
jgi:hypothetical protein